MNVFTATRVALATACLAVAVTACSSTSPTTGPTTTTTPVAADGPVRFTQCVREQGVDLPDPAPGALTVELPPAAKTDPATRDAVAKCGHLLGTGSGKDPNDPAAHDKAVAMARCLREHGLPIEDPAPGEPLRLNVDTKNPAAMQAVQDCRAQGRQPNGG